MEWMGSWTGLPVVLALGRWQLAQKKRIVHRAAQIFTNNKYY
jgi:cytochrome oxidase assembly protein ShyY1